MKTILLALLVSVAAFAADKPKLPVVAPTDYNEVFKGLKFREIGPAAMGGRIDISPADPNVLYVAATGNLWGASKDRGVYKTTDGGKTWSNVLFVNDDTGATDIAIDLDSPGTLIAAMYQRRRTVFGFNGSGPGSGLYKTTDGGATWKKLEKGLPWDPDAKKVADADPQSVKEIGRIGVNFYRRNANVVYALIE